MNKLKFNPNNAKYYSDDFIKGFECGVERQFNADMAEKTAEWIDREIDDAADRWKCSKCGRTEQYRENYCPNCGARMKGEQTE